MSILLTPTLGIGAEHSPNAQITVTGFINATAGRLDTNLVPQQETSQRLDTLGDRIMTPVVYQNRNGTESLWTDHTILLNYPVGPTAIRWYQIAPRVAAELGHTRPFLKNSRLLVKTTQQSRRMSTSAVSKEVAPTSFAGLRSARTDQWLFVS
jgi:hypothetical protein